MKKRFLAIAIAAGLASPFAAQAEANVYGQINLTVGMIEDTSSNGTVTNDDNWQINSHASRLGVKGSEDLGNGLSANYQLEYGVNPVGDGTDKTAGLSHRNQWVGLKGNFGEIRIGRHDTPTKLSQGKFDQFGDLPGDIVGYGNVTLSTGDIRVAKTVAYLGKAGDVKYAIALVPGEGDGVTAGDGPADTISAAVMYEAGPLYVGFGYDQYDDTNAATVNEDLMRLTVTYSMGTMDFGFMYEALGTSTAANEDYTGFGLSFGMGMGKDKVKFQYLDGDQDNVGKANSMSIGYDFGLSKATTLGLMYTDLSNEDTAGTTGDEINFIGMNLLHKF